MTTTNEPTITVQGIFGPKQVTREQFIQRWDDLGADLLSLSYDRATHHEMMDVRQRIKELAGEAFDRALASQENTHAR